LEQCEFFASGPDDISIILIDGGINDVDVTKIIDPFFGSRDLRASVEQHCYREMATLLKCLATKFRSPNTDFIIVGYYPILSDMSSLDARSPIPNVVDLVASVCGRDAYAERHRLAQKGGWPNDPRVNAMKFWKWSDDALGRAVRKVNDGDGRMIFVKSGFQS